MSLERLDVREDVPENLIQYIPRFVVVNDPPPILRRVARACVGSSEAEL